MKKILFSLLIALAGMLPVAFAGTLNAYISPPGAQSSTVSSVTTENFNLTTGSLAASGNLAIGSFSYTTTGTGVRINSGNNDGGACPTGAGTCSGTQTPFLAVSDNNVLSISLTQNAKYLGFWWSAGDAGNTIRFYDQNNNLLVTYTAASLSAFLPKNASTHTSVDGSASYANSSYYSNPTNGSNICCTYAYVNLALDNSDAYIKKIEIYQNPSPSPNGWFELDNMSVRSSVPSASERGSWISYATIRTIEPTPQSTDLGIALDNGVTSVANGGTTSYSLTVSNLGSYNGDWAVVQFPSVAGMTKTSVSCTVPSGSAAFCPAGTLSVSDLEGTGLTIQSLPAGSSLLFTIGASISTNASSITNTATITLPAGVNIDTNSTNNTATDTDQVTNTYTVGGTVTGLAPNQSVVLLNNAGNSTTVNSNTSFTFSTAINSGGAYAVTVGTQPTGQTCTVSSGSGNVSANVTNVAVTCTTNTYTVGGTVTGLAPNQSVVLLNNAGNSTTVNSNSFTFSTAINSGGAYVVTVGTQPTGQTCTVSSGSGNVSANVTNVAVTCTTNTYTVGGTVTGLAPNQSVVLLNNAGNSTTVNSNSFTFSTAINSGGAYVVTVGTQPTGQTCTVSSGSGNVSANVTNVSVTCTTNLAQPIPTLGEWAMIFMASLMAMFGIRRMRRSK